MESLFNSVAGLKVCNFITRTCEICEIFKNTLSYITFEVTASESGLTYQAILNVSHKIAPYEIAPTQFTTTWNKFFKVSIMIINQRFVAINKDFCFLLRISQISLPSSTQTPISPASCTQYYQYYLLTGPVLKKKFHQKCGIQNVFLRY